jgi:sulfoxide reductase heme-binding subunit YedZ
MAYRLMRRFGIGYSPLWLAAVAVLGAPATMLLEAAWYGAATGVPPLAVLKANLDFSFTIRPGWWVGLVGLAVAGLRLLRPAPNKTRTRAGVSPA